MRQQATNTYATRVKAVWFARALETCCQYNDCQRDQCKCAAVRPLLDETEHILEDYVSLMSTNQARTLIANHPDAPADAKSDMPDVQKVR